MAFGARDYTGRGMCSNNEATDRQTGCCERLDTPIENVFHSYDYITAVEDARDIYKTIFLSWTLTANQNGLNQICYQLVVE